MPRKKRFGWLTGITAMLLAVTLVTAACGARQSGGANTGADQKKINIAYIGWDENIALSNLYKAALIKKGWKADNIKMTLLEAGPIFQGISTGDKDLFMDTWLPVTHKKYWKKYKDKVEDLGVWYDHATVGLAVPDYVKDVKSIADLKKHAGEFDNKITGIEPSAGEMDTVQHKAMPAYGLNGKMKLSSSSTATMLGAVQKAESKKKPIVATLWKPHWAYKRYHMHDLQDPKKAMGKKGEKLHSIGRKGFKKDFPKLAKSLEQLKVDDNKLEPLEDMVKDAGDSEEAQLKAAQKWMDKNPDFTKKYLSNL